MGGIKRLLLTGSSGFIGRNLKEYWQNRKDVVLFSPSHSELNLLNEKNVKSYFCLNNIDVVIHTANVNSTRNKDVSYAEQLDGNLRMFFNLVSCNSFFKKMYYFGSGAEYDKDNYIPSMTESYFGKNIPKDAYGFSKYIMAQACFGQENIYDLRLFGVYGPYEEYERRFISNAICRALKGLPITITQNVYFDYLWVGDLCKIMDWMIDNRPQKKHYNVCTGIRVDLLSLAEEVRENLRVNSPIIISKQGLKPEYTGDNVLLKKDCIGDFIFKSYKECIPLLITYYKSIVDYVNESQL